MIDHARVLDAPALVDDKRHDDPSLNLHLLLCQRIVHVVSEVLAEFVDATRELRRFVHHCVDGLSLEDRVGHSRHHLTLRQFHGEQSANIASQHSLHVFGRHDDIKKALEASEEMIKLEAYYYSFSSISAPYQFTLAPQTATVSVEYNGGTHELKFPFYQGGYSYGVGNMTTQTLQLVAAGMYVDGTHSSYFTEMAIIYTGKKI